jgi:hypothetical protein
MSVASILARLDRIERALRIDEPEDNHALEHILAALDLIAENRGRRPAAGCQISLKRHEWRRRGLLHERGPNPGASRSP